MGNKDLENELLKHVQCPDCKEERDFEYFRDELGEEAYKCIKCGYVYAKIVLELLETSGEI